MTYKSIMVAVDLRPHSEQCITLAASLADRFGARLIGAAAEVEFVPVYPEAPVADALLIDTERKRVAGDLEKAESLFRRIAGSRTAVQWRCGAQEPRTFLLENARAADLMVLGRQGQGDDTDWRFGVRPGDVVMELGRPILVVPPGIVNCSARRVIIGWKNTREARRAVSDSMPLLQQSQEVLVVCAGASPREEWGSDVQEYLSIHGVSARTLIRPISEELIADELLRTAELEGADLIVCGAYGHSRLREWMLGGVTRNLLDRSSICCLLAH